MNKFTVIIEALKNAIKTLWGVLVWLFEKADIIPALVIVSAWHYSVAMSTRGDPAPIAIALGVLTDVGHYRSVKGVAKKNEPKRWIVAIGLTALTFYYHFLYYQDIILALCVPALIISLALLSRWDGWDGQSIRIAPRMSEDAPKVSEDDPQSVRYPCGQCQETFPSGAAKANHVRWHHPKGETK
jgi:hypothetical protein